MDDNRYKQIMYDMGMPHSKSLFLALQQVANEASQETERKIALELLPEIKWVRDNKDYGVINACNSIIRHLEIMLKEINND